MKTRYITFHNGNLNPKLVEYQARVFDHLGIPLEQIMHPIHSHGMAIDNFLAHQEWDEIMLFDVDCIPLDRSVLEFTNLQYLLGARQKANHIPNSQIYAGPCFMVFNKWIFNEIGRPSFLPTVRGDCGEEMTYQCQAKGIEVRTLPPTHVEKPMWDLSPGVKFGYGTTYGDIVYHAFESNANHQSTTNFITKCRQVIMNQPRHKKLTT